MTDLLERVYQAFDPALPAVENDVYVDLGDVRGESDVVDRLEQGIRLSAGKTCQLLAGHHGSGKTTELRRLEKRLGEGEKKYFVVFVESSTDLDLNDVDFPEILIAIVRRLADELKSREDISLKPGYFRDRFEKLKDLLGSDVEFEKLGLAGSMFEVSAAIKGSPDARAQVRKALEPDTSNLLHAANDQVGEAMLALSKRNYTNIVIIMDDLDKIVLRPHEDTGCSTAEYLFVNRHAQLTGFACHVVYTMPLDIVYSALGQKIANLYKIEIPVVPMTKIRTEPPGNKAHKPGVDLFRDIITHRLERADADESDVFGKGVVGKLIALSGGQPRALMMLVREALIGGGVPVQLGAVDRVAYAGARGYARQLTDEHLALIKQVAKSDKLKRTKANDEAFRKVLDSRAVLQYVNREEWFGVNPLIAPPRTNRKKK